MSRKSRKPYYKMSDIQAARAAFARAHRSKDDAPKPLPPGNQPLFRMGGPGSFVPGGRPTPTTQTEEEDCT